MARQEPSNSQRGVFSERVSVVIPTYNRANLLAEALASVMAQTHPVLDIAVVDDGSTDHTGEVVELYKRERAPIVYLPGAHLDRLGESRNRGVAATRGEWIAFLDSDDLWLPQRIERQLAALRLTPHVEFAFCNVQRFNERGDLNGPYLDSGRDYNATITGEILQEPMALPSALMVRREAFQELGGFSNRPINEDYELTLHLSTRGPASYVLDVLVRMRAHRGSRSAARQRAASVEYIRIVKQFLAEHPDLPDPVKARGRLGVANVHYKLARLYHTVGDAERAGRHLRAFLRLRPLDRRALRSFILDFETWAGKWTRRKPK